MPLGFPSEIFLWLLDIFNFLNCVVSYDKTRKPSEKEILIYNDLNKLSKIAASRNDTVLYLHLYYAQFSQILKAYHVGRFIRESNISFQL